MYYLVAPYVLLLCSIRPLLHIALHQPSHARRLLSAVGSAVWDSRRVVLYAERMSIFRNARWKRSMVSASIPWLVTAKAMTFRLMFACNVTRSCEKTTILLTGSYLAYFLPLCAMLD